MKSFIRLWRSWLIANNYSCGQHFLHSSSHTDTNSICDSFLCLLLYCHKNDLWFCPQYYTSDHCEQAFCFCRIARYKGRRTNISGTDLIDGLERRNRSIELESHVKSFDPEPVAHARSRSMLSNKEDSAFKNQKARDVDMKTIFKVMNEATNYAAYQASQLAGVRIEMQFVDTKLDKSEANAIRERYSLDISTVRVKDKLLKPVAPNQKRKAVIVAGVEMHIWILQWQCMGMGG